MGCKLTFVDDILNKSFYKLGLVVGRQPGYFIIIPILLSLLMITGYQRVHYEMDPEYLFSPVSGQGKLERRIVEEHFKVNYSHRFNVGRITRAGRFGRVIIVSKDNNTNILRTEVWKELRQLDDLVQNITVNLPNGETFTYREECARWEGQCFVNDILNLDKIIGEVERGELNLTFPIMFNPVTWEAHAFPVYFGGAKVVEEAREVGSDSGTDESLGMSGSSSSSSSKDETNNKYKPKSSKERRGWRKWHRKCPPCPNDMMKKWRDRSIKWICGGYQRARRSFKSECMMYYRNCQDGTMFVKIHDHRCANDTDVEKPRGFHFFYDYGVDSQKTKSSDDDMDSSSVHISSEVNF